MKSTPVSPEPPRPLTRRERIFLGILSLGLSEFFLIDFQDKPKKD